MGGIEIGDSGTDKVGWNRALVVCVLLLFASAINYMDRQTLSSIAPRITTELSLSEKQYGTVEKMFGWGFAVGSLVFGLLVDYIPVRWMYPCALLLWSAMGFLTGFVRGYDDLLICRGLLGFFEAAHWPCGLKTTQSLLDTKSRGLGNSVLQSGTSIGACITPILMLWILTPEPGSWRWGFQAIGFMGIFWVIGWFLFVRKSDLKPLPPVAADLSNAIDWKRFVRKLLTLILFLLTINTTWQILRAWMPKVLQQGIGYSEKETLIFTSVWYIVTDIGCLASGALAYAMASRGWNIKSSRILSVGLSAFLCMGVCLVPFIAKGPLLLAVLLVAGAGALGLFPMFYSFSQDISRKYQGTVTGVSGFIAWVLSGEAQEYFGDLADRTQSYNSGLIIVGILPMIAFFGLLFFWPAEDHIKDVQST
jgi:ACS family hexuronate transporter-like MFS transporter